MNPASADFQSIPLVLDDAGEVLHRVREAGELTLELIEAEGDEEAPVMSKQKAVMQKEQRPRKRVKSMRPLVRNVDGIDAGLSKPKRKVEYIEVSSVEDGSDEEVEVEGHEEIGEKRKRSAKEAGNKKIAPSPPKRSNASVEDNAGEGSALAEVNAHGDLIEGEDVMMDNDFQSAPFDTTRGETGGASELFILSG